MSEILGNRGKNILLFMVIVVIIFEILYVNN